MFELTNEKYDSLRTQFATLKNLKRGEHSILLLFAILETKKINLQMTKSKTINIEDKEILIYSMNNEDYISLTDMARSQLEDVIIIKWLSLKNTIEYIGEWEALYNPDFNYTEFGIIKNGKTAQQWRTENTTLKGNIRDTARI